MGVRKYNNQTLNQMKFIWNSNYLKFQMRKNIAFVAMFIILYSYTGTIHLLHFIHICLKWRMSMVRVLPFGYGQFILRPRSRARILISMKIFEAKTDFDFARSMNWSLSDKNIYIYIYNTNIYKYRKLNWGFPNHGQTKTKPGIWSLYSWIHIAI